MTEDEFKDLSPEAVRDVWAIRHMKKCKNKGYTFEEYLLDQEATYAIDEELRDQFNKSKDKLKEIWDII